MQCDGRMISLILIAGTMSTFSISSYRLLDVSQKSSLRCISGLFCFHVKRLDSGFLILQISIKSNDEQRFSIFLHAILSFGLPPNPSLSQSSITLKSPPIIISLSASISNSSSLASSKYLQKKCCGRVLC